jgi:predicted nucleotidyltransferase
LKSELALQQLPDYLTTAELSILQDVKSALLRALGDRGFRLFLFGSKARGDFDKDSDLDVAVIVDALDRVIKRKIFDAIADVELQHLTAISALVLSSDVFSGLYDRERRIARDILSEGIVL